MLYSTFLFFAVIVVVIVVVVIVVVATTAKNKRGERDQMRERGERLRKAAKNGWAFYKKESKIIFLPDPIPDPTQLRSVGSMSRPD